jgi:hypothetical protein
MMLASFEARPALSLPSPLRGGAGGGGGAATTDGPPPSIPPRKGEGGDRAAGSVSGTAEVDLEVRAGGLGKIVPGPRSDTLPLVGFRCAPKGQIAPVERFEREGHESCARMAGVGEGVRNHNRASVHSVFDAGRN